MNFWFKRKPQPCKHDWHTVALDTSFHTTYTDTNTKRDHHVKWLKCHSCGKRDLFRDGATKHRGIEDVFHLWVETHQIHITKGGRVYDQDYELVTSHPSWNIWKYKPLTGVEKLLKQLKDDADFQNLCKHHMVADAFGQLEVAVKMHENIDKP